MTFEQIIQLANVIGIWCGVLATFTAVLVALHFARRAEKVRLRVNTYIVNTNVNSDKLYWNTKVVNLGERPTTINNIVWKIGKNSSERFIINHTADFSDQFPKIIHYGEEGNFAIEIDKKLVRCILGSKADTNTAKSLRGIINTSVTTVEFKPSEQLLENFISIGKLK